MEEKIKKSDLTQFAKDCVYAHEKAVKLMCISEDIMRNHRERVDKRQSKCSLRSIKAICEIC
jgi:hypothetical protein